MKQAICNMTIYMTALCGDYTQIKLAKIAIAICAPDIIVCDNWFSDNHLLCLFLFFLCNLNYVSRYNISYNLFY